MTLVCGQSCLTLASPWCPSCCGSKSPVKHRPSRHERQANRRRVTGQRSGNDGRPAAANHVAKTLAPTPHRSRPETWGERAGLALGALAIGPGLGASTARLWEQQGANSCEGGGQTSASGPLRQHHPTSAPHWMGLPHLARRLEGTAVGTNVAADAWAEALVLADACREGKTRKRTPVRRG